MAIAEDDMIIGHAHEFFSNDRRTSGLGNTVYGRTWANGIVPYQLTNDLSAASEAKVRSAIDHWNSNAAIKLVERTSQNAAQYPNYLNFISATQCASWVGFQGTGPQDVYVGDYCTTGSMIHEIGHGLGLLHEHTRPDRDAYVKINWANVTEGKEHNFDILSDGAVLLGDYDYGSIMHYGTYFFSTNNAPTLEATLPTNATIGQRQATSQGDRAAVGKLYETDLSINISGGVSQINSGDALELSISVTNNASNGANTLDVTLPVYADTRLLDYSSTEWSCEQAATGSSILCNSDLLTTGQSSQIVLNINASSNDSQMTLTPILNSKTQDSSGANNSDSFTVAVLSDDQGDKPDTVAQAPEPEAPVVVSQPEPTPEQPAQTTGGTQPTPSAPAASNPTVVAVSGPDATATAAPVVIVSTPPTEPEPQLAAATSNVTGGGAGSLGPGLLFAAGLLGLRRRQR